jgi:hypothetical protein
MQNQQILVLDNIKDVNEYEFSNTAKTMFSRLQLGRKNADNLIVEARNNFDDNTEALDSVFNVAISKPLRTLQYIIKNDNIIVNVASNKHTIINKAELRDKVLDVIERNGLDIRERWSNYDGVVAVRRKLKTFFGMVEAGVSVGLGNISLTRSIRIGAYFEIGVCTNPLSFLELKDSNFIGQLGIVNDRLLRIGNSHDVLKKIETSITNGIKHYDYKKIPDQIITNGKREITHKQATTLVKAMSNAYGIGKKITKEILENKPKNIWDLSMNMSKISTDESNFRKDAVKTPAKLSAMSLVLLTETDLPRMIANSEQYCMNHSIL